MENQVYLPPPRELMESQVTRQVVHHPHQKYNPQEQAHPIPTHTKRANKLA